MYQYGKFKAVVKNRDYPVHLPELRWLVVIIQETPKARLLKWKELKRIVFKTEAEADKYAREYIDRIRENMLSRQKEKQDRKNKRLGVSASDYYGRNDFLVSSWGYEQTNVDFYKVIRVLPKSLELVPVHSAIAGKDPYGPMSDFVVPTSHECGDSFIVPVRPGGYCPVGRRSASKWNGEPCYRSWYA